MCGGVGFKLKNISEEELKKYYSQELIDKFKAKKRIESFFWQKEAVLPVRSADGVRLRRWGNKDKQEKLPLTGWARQESLEVGKWDYLKPKFVDIPVDDGYEKKIWFDFEKGTKGILVADKNGEERAYMITTEASADYQAETGHDREPIGKKQNYRK